MKILSSFTLPQNVPNLYVFLWSVEHQAVAGSHSLPLYEKKILWKSMATINCLLTNILQNIFFCVQQKKEIHTSLEQHDMIFLSFFFFFLNYTFNDNDLIGTQLSF